MRSPGRWRLQAYRRLFKSQSSRRSWETCADSGKARPLSSAQAMLGGAAGAGGAAARRALLRCWLLHVCEFVNVCCSWVHACVDCNSSCFEAFVRSSGSACIDLRQESSCGHVGATFTTCDAEQIPFELGQEEDAESLQAACGIGCVCCASPAVSSMQPGMWEGQRLWASNAAACAPSGTPGRQVALGSWCHTSARMLLVRCSSRPTHMLDLKSAMRASPSFLVILLLAVGAAKADPASDVNCFSPEYGCQDGRPPEGRAGRQRALLAVGAAAAAAVAALRPACACGHSAGR